MIRKIVIALAITSAATAQTELTPYLSISGGYGVIPDADFTVSGTVTGKGEIEIDDGFVIEGAAGVKIALDGEAKFPVRTELAYSFQQGDLDQISVSGGGTMPISGNFDISSFMWNGYIDVNTDTPFTPYVLAGIGRAYFDIDGDDDDILAFQFGGGVGYSVTDHVILDLKYKYFTTEDYETSSDGDTIELEFVTHQIQLGLRYQF